MKRSTVLFARLVIATVASVALSAPVMAQQNQKDTPPQITAYQEERPVWNKTTGFGPVPKNLQQIGDVECQKAKYDRAVGYSEQTLNPDGKSFAKGGFMCQKDPKSNS